MLFQVLVALLFLFCGTDASLRTAQIGNKPIKRDLSNPLRFELSVDNWIQIQAPPNWEHAKSSVESCYRMEPGPSTDKYPQVLPKTVFDVDHRHYFVAGLEGSGHHMFEILFEQCDKCTCIEDWEMPETPGFTLSSTQSTGKGFFGSKISAAEYEDMITKFKGTIENVKKEKKGMPVILNTLCAHKLGGIGELSYPNSGGECKGLQYPDVRMLAELMEYADIDLRVIVLVRNSIDVLLSTTVHRNMGDRFKAIDRYMNITDHFLDKQLRRIDSKFIHCIDYDKFPEVPPTFEEFTEMMRYGFSFNDAVKKIFTSHNSDERKQHERKLYILTDEHRAYLRLVKSVNRLRAFCGLELEDYSSY